MSTELMRAIAQPYAAALYELAEQQNALDPVAGDLAALKRMLTESEDLRRLVDSPVMSREDQAKGVAAVAAQAGLNELTGRFLGLVARNRRLFALRAMIEVYLSRLAARRGEIRAQVQAATQLSEKQLSALVATLKQAVGSNVTMDVSIDPGLLGGLVVQIGSRMIDNSLRTKLQHLQLAMKGVG